MALKSSSSLLRTCREDPTKNASFYEYLKSHLDVAVECSLMKHAVLAHGGPAVHDLIWIFAGFEEFEGFVLDRAPTPSMSCAMLAEPEDRTHFPSLAASITSVEAWPRTSCMEAHVRSGLVRLLD